MNEVQISELLSDLKSIKKPKNSKLHKTYSLHAQLSQSVYSNFKSFKKELDPRVFRKNAGDGSIIKYLSNYAKKAKELEIKQLEEIKLRISIYEQSLKKGDQEEIRESYSSLFTVLEILHYLESGSPLEDFKNHELKWKLVKILSSHGDATYLPGSFYHESSC
jgi:hypothetical protein